MEQIICLTVKSQCRLRCFYLHDKNIAMYITSDYIVGEIISILLVSYHLLCANPHLSHEIKWLN